MKKVVAEQKGIQTGKRSISVPNVGVETNISDEFKVVDEDDKAAEDGFENLGDEEIKAAQELGDAMIETADTRK